MLTCQPQCSMLIVRSRLLLECCKIGVVGMVIGERLAASNCHRYLHRQGNLHANLSSDVV